MNRPTLNYPDWPNWSNMATKVVTVNTTFNSSFASSEFKQSCSAFWIHSSVSCHSCSEAMFRAACTYLASCATLELYYHHLDCYRPRRLPTSPMVAPLLVFTSTITLVHRSEQEVERNYIRSWEKCIVQESCWALKMPHPPPKPHTHRHRATLVMSASASEPEVVSGSIPQWRSVLPLFI